MYDNRQRGSLAFFTAILAILCCSHARLAHADSPGALAFSSSLYEASVSDGVVAIPIERAGGSSGDVIATYTTADGTALAGSDYTASSGTLKWADGDDQPKIIWVPISPTSYGGGAFSVALVSSMGATFGQILQTTVSISAAPVSSGTPGAVQFTKSAYVVPSGGAFVIVSVKRVGGSAGSANISYSTFDGDALAGTDYVATSGTLSWADGDASEKSFVVNITSQTHRGGTFSVALLSAEGAAFGNPIDTAVEFSPGTSADVAWTPPTLNTDGSALTDLAGYYIYFGNAQGQVNQTMQIANPSATSVTIANLASGTWYFSAVAYAASGAISSPTNLLSYTIQ